jgi:hypothetical protein
MSLNIVEKTLFDPNKYSNIHERHIEKDPILGINADFDMIDFVVVEEKNNSILFVPSTQHVQIDDRIITISHPGNEFSTQELSERHHYDLFLPHPGRTNRLSDPVGSDGESDTIRQFPTGIRQLPTGSYQKLSDSLGQDSDRKLSDVGSDGFRQSDPIVGKYRKVQDPTGSDRNSIAKPDIICATHASLISFLFLNS